MPELLRIEGWPVAVYTREDARLSPPVRVRKIASSPHGIFVHWSAIPKPRSVDDALAQARAIQRYHMKTKGWFDIAYSALAVAIDGRPAIIWGRGPGVAGGHTRGFNGTSHAVCWLGDAASLEDADLAAIRAAITLIGEAGFAISPVRVHRDVAKTSCPGPKLTEWVHAAGAGWPKSGKQVVPELVAIPKRKLIDKRKYWRPPVTRNLRKGDRGKDAAELQFLLLFLLPREMTKDFAVDGIFGPRTEEAVRWVQRIASAQGAYRGTVDGVAGPRTGHAVVWLLNHRGVWR